MACTFYPCDNARRVRVTIVVPCYNEEHRLRADEFRAFPGVEFLFVNDGSRDGTLQVLQTLAASDPSRLSVLTLEKNGGKAEAVRRARKLARKKAQREGGGGGPGAAAAARPRGPRR